ncbi:hypothetical protein QBC38DRAFT_513610 [Podospora fimiseda]|uniref:DUF1996 domain-containing protein n=1 Tax=Podospora fimiseda TaxID=252190 RepID=A0AAN6YP43_9PEZI|nr:hypothetical protein QBC38DRAFT_513610 [Podospora fimiseda]
MYWSTLSLLSLAAVPTIAVVRFHCSELVVERLDPLVNPGSIPSSHVHQIVGSNAFNATMALDKDLPAESTCTSCQFTEEFSNYWTAVLYFRARNGTYKRVPQLGNNQFEKANGGLTSKVKAFQPGCLMFIGNVCQLTCVCMDTWTMRAPETMAFPTRKIFDSPDHMSHMSYPESGIFESGGPCPATHPVRVGQVMFEVVWDTKKFNDLEWPEDGSSPWVWSFGDATGYPTHADYVFGWKDDSLQRILDTSCWFNTNCINESNSKVQTVEKMNECTQKVVVDEDIDSWLEELPMGFRRITVIFDWCS